MMKPSKNILIAVLLAFAACLKLSAASRGSAPADYNTAAISPALLTGADAVIRSEKVVFEIRSKSEARYTYHIAVTIMNEAGEEDYAQCVVPYDKFTKVVDISGAIYDAQGKQLKRLKNADVADYGYGSDDITDARYRVAGFGKKSYAYPYTIEFDYETKQRNMMFYPRWSPFSGDKVAVEQSSYEVKAPAGFKFRYKEYNGAPPVVRSVSAEGQDVYTWAARETVVGKQNVYPLLPVDRHPLVYLAPSEFEVQGYTGNFNTWEDLGKFYYQLNQGRDVLTPGVAAEVTKLTGDAKSDREKILKIYKWMQARSRYVSIQLGIGGWQTIDALTVSNRGYGDCKALTNFTLAALRHAGIKSYAALVRAGDDQQIRSDFPSSLFNHVIACAVTGKDTIWLECTSQTNLPNFLGSFTGGRPALLVTENGGKLVTTPGYKPEHNRREGTGRIKLESSGDGLIESRNTYTGLQQETREQVMHILSDEEKKKWLLNNINLPSLELRQFSFASDAKSEPSVSESLSMTVRSCATKTGSRLFIKPTLLSRSLPLPVAEERKVDFYLPASSYDYTDVDTLEYQIPAGYKLESVLPDVNIASEFGSFTLRTTLENDRLVCIRKSVMSGGRYKAEQYAGWVDYLKKVRRADRSQVVFVENK